MWAVYHEVPLFTVLFFTFAGRVVVRGRWGLDVLFLDGFADDEIGFADDEIGFVLAVEEAVVVTANVVWFGLSVAGTPLSDCRPSTTPYAVR